jgi:thiol-disulfide isomerase/thioredoxin
MLVGFAVLSACASSGAPTQKSGTCLAPVEVGGTSPSAQAGAAASFAPGLALDCLDGSGPVRLRSNGAAMVVNLWATYCTQCKEELPALQAFANASTGKVAVVGVDTRDSASFGSSYVADHKLTYPMLSDPDAKLSAAIGRSSLPLTLFVRPDGSLAYVYLSPQPLTTQKLAELVNQHLGVRVSL